MDTLEPSSATMNFERAAMHDMIEAVYPRDKCIHQFFEDQVERTPDAIACTHEKSSLTYAELNVRANRLAHRLRALGVTPDARVAICMKRSPEILVALLATLKAGGAYAPLDSAYPATRLQFMVQDCAPVVVLCSASVRQALDHALSAMPASPIVLDLEADCSDWSDLPGGNPAPADVGLTSAHLAYVIYTSGSTGAPKGVMIEHRNAANYLHWARHEYRLKPGLGAPVNTSFAFDATVTSLLAPLVCGGRVDLLPDGEQELGALADALEAGRRYALVKLTPSHLQALQQLRPTAARDTAADAFVIGGEGLAAHQIAFWREKAPGIRLINEYGPTEATVGMIVYEVTADTPHQGAVPIGRPIWNTRVYLLDEQRRPVPQGTDGEIYIGGAGVARGYLNRPDLTAERFIASPFVKGDRLYRTGDLARCLPDGNIQYLGRIDEQVKINGFRIEPAEIEMAIKSHPAVSEAVVVAREVRPGDRRLVAYVAPASASANIREIRQGLNETLPAYMIPSAMVFLGAFPLTTNGKLDRKALPEPDETKAQEEGVDPAEPATPVETALAQIWREVLKAKKVGRSSNFFSIGGNSLLAARVVSRIRGAFQVELKMAAIFRTPTIADLAEQIETLVWARHGNARKPPETGDRLLEGQL